MSLRFWTGPAGSGKSTSLYRFIIDESIKNPELTYLVIVPDQFTLQTQQDIVKMHPQKGILNIDVLSFNRLAHRVFEEVGYGADGGNMIDDMGKNLILRRVSQLHTDELPTLGENLYKLGYITQVKSVISEYMQYGIDIKKAESLAETAHNENSTALAARLDEINVLYREFVSYIKDHYTTREELLMKVCNRIRESQKLRSSVVVFDGFTGFTPVQLSVIEEILQLSPAVEVALTLDKRTKEGEAPTVLPHELFYLSKKTISLLGQIADRNKIPILDSRRFDNDTAVRFTHYDAKMLSHLEKNLFRAKRYPYDGDTSEAGIRLMCGINPEEELELVCNRIKDLVREHGLRYRDIAIITGDIETYRNVIERALLIHEIPFFTDKTRPVLMNPMIEYLRAGISVLSDNYTYESIFRMLKCGFSELSREDIDVLDNYCVALGIAGRKKWQNKFVALPRFVRKKYHNGDRSDDEKKQMAEYLIYVNDLRQKTVDPIMSLESELAGSCGKDTFNAATKCTVSDFARALYNFLDGSHVESKIYEQAEYFRSIGDLALADNYEQIFKRIMNVLEQMVELLSDEKLTIKEFGQLLEAGLDEIRIGIVPATTDYVQVGDLTRSRLRDIRALFVVGANDGIIPSVSHSEGLLGDADRVFLSDRCEGTSFAPTAREGAYTQRLYLYMMLTKPEQYLFVSYAKISAAGESIKPSYIIKTIVSLFPSIKRIECMPSDFAKRISDKPGAYRLLTSVIGDCINGQPVSGDVLEVLSQYARDDKYRDSIAKVIRNAVSQNDSTRYQNVDENGTKDSGRYVDGISRAVVNILYGQRIYSSVSRLETYANCAYEYYLKYGLGLEKREELEFASTDLGTVFHGSLEKFMNAIKESDKKWSDISDDEAHEIMNRAVEEVVAADEMTVLYTTGRLKHMVRRIKRIMNRTADVLKYQASKGAFLPNNFEVDFSQIDNLDALNLKLPDDHSLSLRGRIDRVDTCTEGDTTYVKVIDYKSGDTKLDIEAVYEGRQLQLVVYLATAMEMIGKSTGKEIVPAGILYYHIDDPIISTADESIEAVENRVRKLLKMKGYVNSDKHVLELMDNAIQGKSDVIPAGIKGDGELYVDSNVLSTDEFNKLIGDAKETIGKIGERMITGDIDTAIERNDVKKYPHTCDFCDYKSVCRQRRKDNKSEDTGPESEDTEENGGDR